MPNLLYIRKGKIEVTGRRESSKVIIGIKDNGEGIEPEDLNQIFKPFFTRKSKDSGLGLTICKELIGLHMGNIEIESTKGEGTTVKIRLPLTTKIGQGRPIS